MGASSPQVYYDCNGRIASWRTFVYFFMARDGDGPMYVKIGRSDNPIKRVGEVRTGCPLPIIKAGMVKCLDWNQAKRIEREFHRHLADRGSSGEWFRFDWHSSVDREHLQTVMGVVLAEVPEWKLEQIDLGKAASMYAELAAERQRKSRRNRKGAAVQLMREFDRAQPRR